MNSLMAKTKTTVQSKQRGFTIVESMIVLGVSGLLLLAVITMVGGRQSKAQFRSSITDIVSVMQTTINEAASGRYPKSANFTCTPQLGYVRVSAGGTEQGANSGCIFLGRAIMIGDTAADPQQYFIHTLVGRRTDSVSSKEVTSLQQANVCAVIPGIPCSAVDLSETKTMQYGTSVAWMRNSTNSPISGVAFVLDPGGLSYDATTGFLKSGSFNTTIYPIAGATGGSLTVGANKIISTFAVASSAGPVRLCLKSGATSQSALITIGGGSDNNSVELTRIYNTPGCS